MAKAKKMRGDIEFEVREVRGPYHVGTVRTIDVTLSKIGSHCSIVSKAVT